MTRLSIAVATRDMPGAAVPGLAVSPYGVDVNVGALEIAMWFISDSV
ncbi:hypothetical protein HUS70_07030 [Pandoraea nosoerga]|nr:hypothetical protein [Pandoraea nosoerga]MBN4674198.1 hypothetical protein [Pandoraea nosoerga]MBN4679868.1 hypothetical protein [Pandoraea nosoerga]MBN4744417.1 hypothetical protein [Pandoraea nosoerga]